jgi:hypothetical protein
VIVTLDLNSTVSQVKEPRTHLELRQDGGVVLCAQLHEAPPQVVPAAAQLRSMLLSARTAQLLLLAGASRLVQLLPGSRSRCSCVTVSVEAA